MESLKEDSQCLQSNRDNDTSASEAPTEEFLAEQRKLAFQRVAQKRQEEDRLIAERLKREEEEKLQYKKKMEEKAEKLKQLTAQRVAEYKVGIQLTKDLL